MAIPEGLQEGDVCYVVLGGGRGDNAILTPPTLLVLEGTLKKIRGFMASDPSMRRYWWVETTIGRMLVYEDLVAADKLEAIVRWWKMQPDAQRPSWDWVRRHLGS